MLRSGKTYYDLERCYNNEQPKFLTGKELIDVFNEKYPDPIPINSKY